VDADATSGHIQCRAKVLHVPKLCARSKLFASECHRMMMMFFFFESQYLYNMSRLESTAILYSAPSGCGV
jgi:hypothetical protein